VGDAAELGGGCVWLSLVSWLILAESGGCLLLQRKLAEFRNPDLGNWLLWEYFLDWET